MRLWPLTPNPTLALWIAVTGLMLTIMGILFFEIRQALDLPFTTNLGGLFTGILPGLLVVLAPIVLTMYFLHKTYPDLARRRRRQKHSPEHDAIPWPHEYSEHHPEG